jgi:hypothetical protein
MTINENPRKRFRTEPCMSASRPPSSLARARMGWFIALDGVRGPQEGVLIPRRRGGVSKSWSSLLLALGLLGLSSGCAASFKLKDPPPGFIEVSSSKWDGDAEVRMKAPDNVGLNITTFANNRGGTLPLWSEDMIKKFSDRGYVLTGQEAVKSRNGVEGTRFEFLHEPPGSDDGVKFYTAVLFVTDAWIVVVQIAGKSDLAGAHTDDLAGILAKIKIRGCKLRSDVCKAGQPRRFETGQLPKPNGPGPDADKPAEEQPAEEKPAEEKPVEAPPAEEKPADSKPTEEKKKPAPR